MTELHVKGHQSGKAWVTGRGIVQPMEVAITIDDPAAFVVTHTTTSVFGCGRDVAAAIEDFRSAVTETFEALDSAESLSASLADELRLLRWHLGRRS